MSRESVIVKAIEQGRQQGRLEMRKIVLDHLEDKYLSKGVIRGDVAAQAILDLASELSQLMKAK